MVFESVPEIFYMADTKDESYMCSILYIKST